MQYSEEKSAGNREDVTQSNYLCPGGHGTWSNGEGGLQWSQRFSKRDAPSSFPQLEFFTVRDLAPALPPFAEGSHGPVLRFIGCWKGQ